MNRRVLGRLCAPLLLQAGVLGHGMPSARQVQTSAPAAVTQSTPPASTTVRRRGRIDQYDPATRTLSLATDQGTIRFALPAAIRVRQGWHRVDALELRRLVGELATVRYTESSSHRIVESVHVFGK